MDFSFVLIIGSLVRPFIPDVFLKVKIVGMGFEPGAAGGEGAVEPTDQCRPPISF